MYKQASRIGLKIQTSKGVLSVDQLWSLSLSDLTTTIIAVKKTLKKTEDDDLDFLKSIDVKDPENELRFNILKDIYLTRKKEIEDIKSENEKKAFNNKIMDLIASKQEDALKNKSIDELEALLK